MVFQWRLSLSTFKADIKRFLKAHEIDLLEISYIEFSGLAGRFYSYHFDQEEDALDTSDPSI